MGTIIGISYERMDESKSKLSKARDVAQEEKNKLIEAASVLGATSSQKLKSETDIINDMIRKVDIRMDNIERVMASIDYSIRRFQEVDEQIASRIKNGQINDIRNQKLQVAGTNIGIFSSSLIDDGSKAWKYLEGEVAQWYDKSKAKVNNVAKIAIDATGTALGYVVNKGSYVKNGFVNEATNAWNEIKGSADAALSFTGSTVGETFNNLLYKPIYAIGKVEQKLKIN